MQYSLSYFGTWFLNQNYSVSWWIPSFDEATKFNKSLYNVINATRAVIGRYP